MRKFLILFVFIFFFSFFIINNILFPLKYEETIKQMSNKYKINASVVASVICAESGFNKNSISNKGAIGLMQLMPSTAEWIYGQIYASKYDDEHLFNEKINIELGCYYLNYLNNKFQNLECVLCAYNAGETTVREWLRNSEYSLNGTELINIPYLETKKYVKRIKNYIKIYSFKLN